MGLAPILLPKKLVLQTAVNSTAGFSNASGPLYQQAQRNLDVAQQQLIALIGDRDKAKNALTSFLATYQTFFDEIKYELSPNRAIEKIIITERYGHPDSITWASVGNLKNSVPGGNIFSQTDWNNHVYGQGISGGGAIKSFQTWLVKHWRDNQYVKTKASLDSAIASIDKLVVEKTKEIDTLKARLDAAIRSEEIASGQRIQENMSTPAYIEAKAKADAIAAAAAQKRRNTNTVLALGALAIIGTAVVIIMRKS